jgi:hypothetical protein
MDKTLPEQIACSVEDAKALLENNRSLSVALLARLLKEHEEANRRRFEQLETEFREYRALVKAEFAKHEKRITLAGRMFKDVKDDVNKLKEASQ